MTGRIHRLAASGTALPLALRAGGTPTPRCRSHPGASGTRAVLRLAMHRTGRREPTADLSGHGTSGRRRGLRAGGGRVHVYVYVYADRRVRP
ncbi:hypothetical protein GCM10010358_17470 [Streptomyces minutiscleroticus]|uniref:Uncharacterized protein n=1 Tax=Streptomyces minutiscleroticus TaxID=68238 RepID=A0A918KJQ7_9ACTN|nr:hypothetical protein GCM10010358_17470 [Streptomyces minutiscleroticus]